jgi:aspartate/methionine/tyrosine aminotransferase
MLGEQRGKNCLARSPEELFMTSCNPLVIDVASPPIPEAKVWGQTYKGAYGPFIDLSQAVPGYVAERGLLQRLAQAAGDPNLSGYGPILGDDALRQAYARHVSRLYHAAIDSSEVAVTAGCNQAFFVSIIGLAKSGDAIILPYPWYFNHQMTLAMLGIEVRALRCRPELGFVPDPQDAEELIDDRVKAIVLITPNNPTGAVYPADTIAAFRDLCERHSIVLIIDETYRDFLALDRLPPHRLLSGPEWPRTVVQLYSFSKTYCIPGHRLGAIVAGGSFLRQVEKVLDSLQICAPRAGQTALAWALEGLSEWRDGNRVEIERRALALTEAFRLAPEWRIESIGAYFAYARHPFADSNAVEIAARLARERGVLGLPGSYFGAEQQGHLRLAFANVTADVLQMLAPRLAGFGI